MFDMRQAFLRDPIGTVLVLGAITSLWSAGDPQPAASALFKLFALAWPLYFVYGALRWFWSRRR